MKVEGPPESTEHTIDSDGVKATDSTDDNEEEKATEKTGTEGKAGEAVDKMDLVAPGDGRATKGDGREGGGVTKANETVPTRESGVNDGPPLVVTEIVVVTFSEGEQVRTPKTLAIEFVLPFKTAKSVILKTGVNITCSE